MLPKARDGRKADEGLCAIAQPAQLASQVGITSRRRSVVPSRASKDDELGMGRLHGAQDEGRCETLYLR